MFASGLHMLRSAFRTEDPPTKVLEVRQDSYTDRLILYREDAMILYEPKLLGDSKKNEKLKYEVVLHSPYDFKINQAYSLCRSETSEEAELRFICFKDKIPLFVSVSKDMLNLTGLQRLCDSLNEHPGWNVAHLAAHFGMHDLFKNPLIGTHMNSYDVENGMSPLQLAVIANNLKTVQYLVSFKCSVEHIDSNGDSVFHHGASTNRNIILALCEGNPRCLNSRNNQGFTALHKACKADKPDCVKALILSGADVNITASEENEKSTGTPGYVGDVMKHHQNTLHQEDMKFGGTPLHWSCSRIVIEALVQNNCDINALNFNDRTALHIMVMRNRLECVVSLLSHNADPDLGDCNGNRPIHLAVREANVPIIQCLAVFGANLDLLNNDGHTARHLITVEKEAKVLYYLHAVGAIRCATGTSGCTSGCIYNGTNDGIPPPPVPTGLNRDALNEMLSKVAHAAHKKSTGGRLLCLDGGGIRGLILIQMLLELEKVFQRPIVHCFDWIAGTSTGGILALGLASGKTLKECLCIYFRMKEHTFVGVRPYPSEALETILKECFGTETVMADIQKPKLLITGVLADRKPVDLHLFRNYESPAGILKVEHNGPYEIPAPPEEQLLWHVGRATGAAPSYFRAFGRFLDGGLIANNPTLDALTEINEYNLSLKAVGRDIEIQPVSIVVSLGTGMIPVIELKGVDVYRPESIWDGAKLLMGISALGTLLVDQATASDGRVVDRARAWCSMVGVIYYRFSPQLSEDIAMDEKSDEKLVKMLWEAKSYMHSCMSSMVELSTLLD